MREDGKEGEEEGERKEGGVRGVRVRGRRTVRHRAEKGGRGSCRGSSRSSSTRPAVAAHGLTKKAKREVAAHGQKCAGSCSTRSEK